MLILQMMTNLPTSNDMSSRATAKIAELGPDSVHQSGPELLCLPRSEWPVTQDSCTVEHQEFVYRKGQQLSIVSDQGSQLVAANKVVVGQLDWKEVVEKNPRSEWIFVPLTLQLIPSNSQYLQKDYSQYLQDDYRLAKVIERDKMEKPE